MDRRHAAPFGGRFIVHGGEVEALEGSGPGDLIVIEFQTAARPAPGYSSGVDEEIVALRMEQLESDVIMVDG